MATSGSLLPAPSASVRESRAAAAASRSERPAETSSRATKKAARRPSASVASAHTKLGTAPSLARGDGGGARRALAAPSLAPYREGEGAAPSSRRCESAGAELALSGRRRRASPAASAPSAAAAADSRAPGRAASPSSSASSCSIGCFVAAWPNAHRKTRRSAPMLLPLTGTWCTKCAVSIAVSELDAATTPVATPTPMRRAAHKKRMFAGP